MKKFAAIISFASSFGIFILMLWRFFGRKRGFPAFDSISINPYLIFIFGVGIGIFVMTFINEKKSTAAVLGVILIFLAAIIFSYAHFNNFFHYIDPIFPVR